MWFFSNKQTELLNPECDQLCRELDMAIGAANNIFANPFLHINENAADVWMSSYSYLIPKTEKSNIRRYRKCRNGKILAEKAKAFNVIPRTLKNNIINHNGNVAKVLIEEGYRLIGNIEGQRLDEQQMLAIVKPSKNHLIIAGAGTGKTTTIVGKIKYLLNKKLCNPEDILVLSFTNASASEMSERIKKEAGCPIAASTFHKLGLEIIKEVEGKMPKIYSKSISSFVRDQLNSLMKNPDYLNNLCGYALYYRSALRTEGDFASNEEYQDYLSTNVPTTLNGETVKSYG